MVKAGAPLVEVRDEALCEVLQRLADPHARPVEGTSQSDQHEEQQHGPRGVDARVGLRLHPRPRDKTSGWNAE